MYLEKISSYFALIHVYVFHRAPAKLPLNQLAANKVASAAAAVAATAIPSQTNSSQAGLGQGLLLQPQPVGPAAASSSAKPASGDFLPAVSTSPESLPELLPLTDIFVPLEKIQPGEIMLVLFMQVCGIFFFLINRIFNGGLSGERQGTNNLYFTGMWYIPVMTLLYFICSL